ncbi:metal-sensing transcriptional repressor [Candidatus Microgenomates bacterium]|nr:metal-sensing transcriptional repressor [Candidatus Microgenomates bacterium]
MNKLPSQKEKLTHRIKIAKGHLEKILQMVENGEYCIDIINQSRAVQNALKEVDYLLLENHLQTCVVDFVKRGEVKKSTEEIMKVFKQHDL